jgi:hypothetical protein
MTNDETPIGVIIFIVAIALFGVGMVMMGSVVSEKGNITQGRNEGIIFCSEKPKECAVEYSYIKLKSNQK